MGDILLTCQAVTFVDGYPVLRKVFRHLARTPKTYRVWVETAKPGRVHFVLEYSSGSKEMYHPVELRGNGSDAYDLTLPAGYEGGVSIVMIDAETWELRASRHVHFGGLGWHAS